LTIIILFNFVAPGAPQASRQSAPSSSVPNPFGADDQDDGGYEEMGAQPGMGNLRQALAQDPQMLAQVLQNLQQSNPELVQQLLANPQALQALLGGAGGEGGQDGGEEGDEFESMEEPQHVVQLTPAEEATVRRLTEMGFPFERALEVTLQRARIKPTHAQHFLQAYLFCDRNEELAVNYLLEHMNDDQ
jgi:UV excision repair protein RAD23